MEKTLQELIADRKKLAVKKKIKLKVEEISKCLGIGDEGDNPGDSSSRGYIFRNADFLLENDSYSNESRCEYKSTITFRGQVVYEYTRKGLQSYIPGSWEEEFEKLYLEVIEKSQELVKVKEEEEKQRENQLRLKWGL